MTEAEWLAGTDPTAMLYFLRGTAGQRKLLLFGCACCRRIWRLIPAGPSRRGVEALEEFLDGHLSVSAYGAATLDSLDAIPDVEMVAPAGDPTIAQWQAALAVRCACHAGEAPSSWRWVDAAAARAAAAAVTEGLTWTDPAWQGLLRRAMSLSGHPAPAAAPWELVVQTAVELEREEFSSLPGWAAERSAQAELLRDITGNPFCVTKPEEAWLTWNGGTVASLAREIYDERAFDRLPLLADMLEDAGCTSAAFLDHCRSGGEHARGCWVVDSLLSWHGNVLLQGGHWS